MSDEKEAILALSTKARIMLKNKKNAEAIETLTDVINRLSNNHQDVELKDTLELSYLDRIRLKFTAEQYNEVVLDIHALQQLGFDIYNDKEMFLILCESKTALHDAAILDEIGKLKLKYDKDIERVKERITKNARKLYRGIEKKKN